MQRNQFAYGVLLPRELRDRFMTAESKSMTARLPIVAINVTTDRDPTGVQKGTILTNPRDDDDAYAGLAFRGYLGWATGEVKLIGRELAYYDLFAVDLSRAERMVSLLRKIRAAEAKLPVTPADLGQYVALLAPAVGIRYMVTAEDEETERRNCYPEGWYRIGAIRDAQVYLQNLIVSVGEKYLPTIQSQVGSAGID